MLNTNLAKTNMIETPKIVTLPPQITAKIYQVIPCSEIQKVMGKTLQELASVIQAQGVAITGPWFTHHLQAPEENFDFEVCFPVVSTVAPQGRVEAGERPAMKAARTVYHGSYEGLGEAWGEFGEWLRAQGHATAEDLYESYLVGPETSSDPADWRTELCRQVT